MDEAELRDDDLHDKRMARRAREREELAGLKAEIERLRAFIRSLDGKTIAIRGEGDTFIDDGIIVADDILAPEQSRSPDHGGAK